MKTAISAIFLLAVCGMFVVYPLYFYFLNEFKNKLKADHSDIWSRLASSNPRSSLQIAYRALQLSKGGKIEDIKISDGVLLARRRAEITLYLGMLLFLVVLGIGLYESVSAGKY